MCSTDPQASSSSRFRVSGRKLNRRCRPSIFGSINHVAPLPAPEPDNERGSLAEWDRHSRQGFDCLVFGHVHERAHRPSGVERLRSERRRSDRPLHDGDVGFGRQEAVPVRDIDAYEANAGLDETLTVVAGSYAEI